MRWKGRQRARRFFSARWMSEPSKTHRLWSGSCATSLAETGEGEGSRQCICIGHSPSLAVAKQDRICSWFAFTATYMFAPLPCPQACPKMGPCWTLLGLLRCWIQLTHMTLWVASCLAQTPPTDEPPYFHLARYVRSAEDKKNASNSCSVIVSGLRDWACTGGNRACQPTRRCCSSKGNRRA